MAHLWHYSWGSTTYLNEDLATHYLLVTRPTCYHHYQPPPRARTYTNTFSPPCYQLAFPFKPAADSITTLDSNCTSRSCLIELTRSRNWCHLTHWSWETMRQKASWPPTHLSSIFFSLIHLAIPLICHVIAHELPDSLLTFFTTHWFQLSLALHFLLLLFQGRYRDVLIKKKKQNLVQLISQCCHLFFWMHQRNTDCRISVHSFLATSKIYGHLFT